MDEGRVVRLGARATVVVGAVLVVGAFAGLRTVYHLDDTVDEQYAAYARVSGALDASGTPAPAPAGTDASATAATQLLGLVDKYGPVIVGLLAGNLLVGLLLCLIGLAACLRSRVRTGVQSRSINPSYAPVRVKDAEQPFEVRAEYHD